MVASMLQAGPAIPDTGSDLLNRPGSSPLPVSKVLRMVSEDQATLLSRLAGQCSAPGGLLGVSCQLLLHLLLSHLHSPCSSSHRLDMTVNLGQCASCTTCWRPAGGQAALILYLFFKCLCLFPSLWVMLVLRNLQSLLQKPMSVSLSCLIGLH